MEREETAIIISIFTLVFLGAIIITLFIIFQKRKNSLILKQKDAEKRFEIEISKTQIEIREETFRNISWELHDNIGQLITLAKIQLQTESKPNDIKLTLDKALKELRTISKVINPEFLNSVNLSDAITLEIERLNRLKFINSSFSEKGIRKTINKKAEVILFRIFQEIISNTIKHAKATELFTLINYLEKEIIITIKDNGKGFDVNNFGNSGIGLNNIKKRASLINATVKIKSNESEGTSLTITYPYKS